MKKTYIIPEVSVVNTIVKAQLLSNSLIISDEEVTSGWTKDAGSWGDMWEDDADSDDSFDF